MGVKNIQSMSDIVQAMNKLVDTVNKFVSDHGYDMKLAEILQISVEPDEVFLADNIMKIICGVENMAITLKYLDKPVKIQGKLRIVGEDTFFLDQTPVKDGEKIEVFVQNKWYLLTVMHNPKKVKGSILIDNNERIMAVSTVNGADARMR